MKSLALKSHAFSSGKCFSFPALYPLALNAFRGTGTFGKSANKVQIGAYTLGLLGSVWKSITSPSKSCIECLADISMVDERCPHCRTLQSTEDSLLRPR